MGNWGTVPPEVVSSTQPMEAEWWKMLNDPVLDGLVEKALKDSPDLKAAAARVEQARGGRLAAQSVLWPSIDAARAFYESPEYQPVLALRLQSAASDVALVVGYDGA